MRQRSEGDRGGPMRICHKATAANTGRRFTTGSDELGPYALLRTANRVIRSAHADDLYQAALPWGVPFDLEAYAQGGAKAWVVLDTAGTVGLQKRLGQIEGAFKELERADGGARHALT